MSGGGLFFIANAVDTAELLAQRALDLLGVCRTCVASSDGDETFADDEVDVDSLGKGNTASLTSSAASVPVVGDKF